MHHGFILERKGYKVIRITFKEIGFLFGLKNYVDVMTAPSPAAFASEIQRG
jgi:hypothetical protein